MLAAARAVQGAFAALLAPAVLALTTIAFPGGRERARAFGLLGALAGADGVIGLVLGGVLTEYAGWRWTMCVNVIFAGVAIAGAVTLLDREHGAGVPGLTGPAPRSSGPGWCRCCRCACWLTATAPTSCGSPCPGGNFAVTFLMAYFLQAGRGLPPALTGAAMVPTVAGIMTGANLLGATLLPRLGPRPLGAGGLLLSAGAMLWLAQLSVTSPYWTGILMPLYVFGIGQEVSSTVAMSTATLNLDPRDVGVGSAAVNVMQQADGSLGTALLSTISAASTAAYLAAHPGRRAAAGVHGDNLAFVADAVWLAVAALARATPGARHGRVSERRPRQRPLSQRPTAG